MARRKAKVEDKRRGGHGGAAAICFGFVALVLVMEPHEGLATWLMVGGGSVAGVLSVLSYLTKSKIVAWVACLACLFGFLGVLSLFLSAIQQFVFRSAFTLWNVLYATLSFYALASTGGSITVVFEEKLDSKIDRRPFNVMLDEYCSGQPM